MQKKQGSMTLLIVLALAVLCCLLVLCLGVVAWYTGGEWLKQFGLPQLPLPAIPGQAPTQPVPSVTAATGASPVLYLAGRTDISIPPLGQPSDVSIFSCRDSSVVQEVFPPGYRITPGSEFTFQASGQINYFGGPLEQGFLPDGDPNSNAQIDSFGGISAYQGPSGALTGVFLTDVIPLEPAPDLINFKTDGIGKDFARLDPQIGQVFLIGDGVNSAGKPQVFAAPAGATRLFIGLVDAVAFYGTPTCYADNVGSFNYTVNSNQSFSAIP
ncbi:MAG: hypothetical protein NT121_10020 [Chloroflexi bacterium]|nr:hypothetical protein [Chloroflexota bacterium]